jgi:anthranilate synthase component I
MFTPAYDVFAGTYETGAPTLLATRLVGDLETPVSAFLKLSASRMGRLFLLESVEGGGARGGD